MMQIKEQTIKTFIVWKGEQIHFDLQFSEGRSENKLQFLGRDIFFDKMGDYSGDGIKIPFMTLYVLDSDRNLVPYPILCVEEGAEYIKVNDIVYVDIEDVSRIEEIKEVLTLIGKPI